MTQSFEGGVGAVGGRRVQRVLITGCAMGMGAAVTAAFVAHGSSVVGLDIDPAGGDVVSEAELSGAVAHFIECDIAVEAEVQRAVDQAGRLLGGLDALVHVAAIAGHKPAADLVLEEWNRVIAVNSTATMLLNRAVSHTCVSPRARFSTSLLGQASKAR